MESLSNFYEKGKRTAYIAVFDYDNHVNKITRDVIYEDYEEPVFELTAPFDLSIKGERERYYDSGTVREYVCR